MGDHVDDLRQQGVGADTGRAHDKSALTVHRAADDGVAFGLGHRHRFAADHGFVDIAAAFRDLAVDRDLFAGTHAQQIAGGNPVERHLLVVATLDDTPGGRRRQVEQGPERIAGFLAGPQLQHLAEQDEHNDD